MSPEQAEVILTSVGQLPSGNGRWSWGGDAGGAGGVWDASDLARTGRHLVHVVDPDTTDRRLERQLAREERASHLDRYLALTFDGAGGVRLKGRGSAEDGAHLKAALLPLTAPAPAPASATALDDSTTSTGSWCTSRGRRGIRGRRVPGCGTPSSAGSPDS